MGFTFVFLHLEGPLRLLTQQRSSPPAAHPAAAPGPPSPGADFGRYLSMPVCGEGGDRSWRLQPCPWGAETANWQQPLRPIADARTEDRDLGTRGGSNLRSNGVANAHTSCKLVGFLLSSRGGRG
jgi:hypothetical protein